MSSAISLRTAIEYAVILGLFVAYLGGYKLSSSAASEPGLDDFNGAAHTSQDKLESLVYPRRDLECPEHALDIHVFSVSPLIIHISNFVTDQEAQHLVDLS